jgi:K+ transporter
MKEIMQHVDILTALNPYYAYDLLANYPNGFGCSAVFFAPQEPKPYILI